MDVENDLKSRNMNQLPEASNSRTGTYITVSYVIVSTEMSQRSDPAAPAPAKSAAAHVDQEKIRGQLDRILASSLFRTSQRCQALLRHVVERSLAGETGTLKERALGIDVFGRAPDYDTNADPIVRGTAGEIRKKLAQYYQDPGHSREPRIDLNRGGYIPEFHPGPESAAPPGWPKARVGGIAAAVVAVAVGAALLVNQWREPALDRFWAPILSVPEGVLISIAQPRVYNFRSDARQREIETMIEGMSPAALASSQDVIPLSQLIPMWDRYMAVGDVSCLVRLASVFEKRGKPYRIRSEAATSFSDLRERPSILIGAFDNEWTLRLLGETRYTFYKDFQGLELVHDRDHPDNTDWKLVNSWPQWNISNDYAIVSRVFDVHTDRVAVVAAGITQFGTAGAGDFLSNPQYFAEVTSRLPKGWARKNLQIVLRVPVVQGVAGHPQVLDTYVW